MTSTADTYNYPAFSFGLEEGAFERFLADAPQLGAPATPFELPDLEGRHHRLSDWVGRPVVIEFGSFTCPIFCGHSGAMEQLAREHPEATFVVIYTREAHPGERVGSHRSIADKIAAARRLQGENGLERLLLVDDLDGTVNREYGGVWDSVFVLEQTGKVILRRAWNDPAQVGAVLDRLANGATEGFESVDMAPPLPVGGFGHGLLRGGDSALLDFYGSAPPPVRQLLETSQSDAVRAVLAAAASDAVVGAVRSAG